MDLARACFEYDRCIITDEPAVDRVPLTHSGPGLAPFLAALSAQSFAAFVLLDSAPRLRDPIHFPIGRTVAAKLRMVRLLTRIWTALVAVICLAFLYDIASPRFMLAAITSMAGLVPFRLLALRRYRLRGSIGPEGIQLWRASEAFRARVKSIVGSAT